MRLVRQQRRGAPSVPSSRCIACITTPSQHKGHIEKWVLTAAALYVNLWKGTTVPRSRSEQNATNARWPCSSQWSLCQVRHTVLLWQPAELWEPSALWARHWISGLSSSGSLSVQYSTVLLDGKCSHRLALCFTVSAASPDFYFSLHVSSFLRGQGCSDFWWGSGSGKQQAVSVLCTWPWLMDNSWFPSFSCYPPLRSQPVSGTVKLPASSINSLPSISGYLVPDENGHTVYGYS